MGWSEPQTPDRLHTIVVTASAALAQARTLPSDDAALLLSDALRAIQKIAEK